MSPPTPWLTLRHHRRKAGLTLLELAKLAGLSKSYVEHLEAGRRNPSDQAVYQLAKALAVKAADLRADYAPPPQAIDQLREQLNGALQQLDRIAEAFPTPRVDKTTQEVA